jgi:hypothetical protein
MVEKTLEKQVADSNPIIHNWEYLDKFLSKYINNYYESKDSNSSSIAKLFNKTFNVKERKKNIPTINIIREKLWLYFYKEHFAKNSKR